MVVTERQTHAEAIKKADHFSLLLPHEFLRDLQVEVPLATERVWGMAMDMQYGHASALLQKLFLDAAQKTLDTRLYIDSYAKDHTDDASTKTSFPTSAQQDWHNQRRIQNQHMFRELLIGGVVVDFSKPPFMHPGNFVRLMGRDHRKIIVIDNKVGYIGGMNFSDTNFKTQDCMIKLTDPRMVQTLGQQFIEPQKKDTVIPFPDGSRFIVDTGKIGRSTILKEDARTIEQTNGTVKCVIPYLPAGPFLQALEKAVANGAKVEIVVAHPDTLPISPLKAINKRRMNKLKNGPVSIYIYQGNTHAKIYTTKQKDGTTVTRFGSHNAEWLGVMAGTKEIVMQTPNGKIAQETEDFFEKLRQYSEPL